MADDEETADTEETTDEPELQDTYRPRTTHTITVEREAPHGEMREITYQIKAGFVYDVIPEEEAGDVLGTAMVNNVTQEIRESALPKNQ